MKATSTRSWSTAPACAAPVASPSTASCASPASTAPSSTPTRSTSPSWWCARRPTWTSRRRRPVWPAPPGLGRRGMPIIRPTKTKMPVRPSEARRTNWEEVALGYTSAQAMAEALRCLQCQDPVCELGCPVNAPTREFIADIPAGDFAAAARAMKRRNLLPAICGRVCPEENQCELLCVVNGKQQAVAIGNLERFAADWEAAQGLTQAATAPAKRPQKIAVIGSGPSGLTAACDLALLGYGVTVFEALHALGGVLRYGIPEFRLPKAILEEDIERLQAMGVEFQTNVVVGKTVTIDQLLEEMGYSAIFIGTGAGTPKFLGVPGENLKGVYSANEFLTRVNLMHARDFPRFDTPVHRGSGVAVIGAGDTAMDAVRTAIRLGAKEAHIVYRRTEQEMGAREEEYHHAQEDGALFLGVGVLLLPAQEMGAREEEYHHAQEEGAVFDWLTQPVGFVGGEDGWVRGMRCIRMELGAADESGRRRPVPVDGSEFVLPVDTVVVALGTNPNPLVPQTTAGLATNAHGCVVADEETGATTREGLYAGGDIVTGAATVVLATGAGRKAAAALHPHLQEKSPAATEAARLQGLPAGQAGV